MPRMTEDFQRFWDAQAADFDDEPDHGLRDAVVRAVWERLLLPEMPDASASVSRNRSASVSRS
jgi:hypothetical protein